MLRREKFLRLPLEVRKDLIASLSEEQLLDLRYDWNFWAREKQLPPPGDWAIWLIKAGRGFGKTLTGAHWVHSRAMESPKRWVAMVAKTPADARDYMVEGPGGILRNTPASDRPVYEVGKRRLTWPNGSWATIYSDEVPDQLRGFSGDTAWLDEFAKFHNPIEVWDNLQFGMREKSADRPRALITTTPRPLKILQDIAKLKTTAMVEGSSYENKDNLAPEWFSGLVKYEGTRIGRQEIHGEILEDVSGALWSRATLERLRVSVAPNSFRRVVIAIDPSAGSGEEADEAGLVAVGLGHDDHAYVLEDASGVMNPTQWAAKAIALFEKYKADKIIAEVNNGGEMVETTLRVIAPGIPFRAVHASRGKVVRAEPASTLYERSLVHHIGGFPQLEDQMCAFTLDWDKKAAGYSPDRVDALVWALYELMLEHMPGYGVFEFYRQEAIKVGMPDGPTPIQLQPIRLAPPNYGWSFFSGPQPQPPISLVKLRVPKDTSCVFAQSGQRYMVLSDGSITVTPEDARTLISTGRFERMSV